MQAISKDIEFNRQGGWPLILVAVRDHWTTKLGGRDMPSRKDIRPSDLKAYLTKMFMIDVLDRGADFRYRLIGGDLASLFPADPSRTLMSVIAPPFRKEIITYAMEIGRRVVAGRAPMRVTGSSNALGLVSQSFDAWLAPLSDDDSNIATILGAFDFASAKPQQPGIYGARMSSRGY